MRLYGAVNLSATSKKSSAHRISLRLILGPIIRENLPKTKSHSLSKPAEEQSRIHSSNLRLAMKESSTTLGMAICAFYAEILQNHRWDMGKMAWIIPINQEYISTSWITWRNWLYYPYRRYTMRPKVIPRKT